MLFINYNNEQNIAYFAAEHMLISRDSHVTIS